MRIQERVYKEVKKSIPEVERLTMNFYFGEDSNFVAGYIWTKDTTILAGFHVSTPTKISFKKLGDMIIRKVLSDYSFKEQQNAATESSS